MAESQPPPPPPSSGSSVITITKKLHKIFQELGIRLETRLPQVAVVGRQNSGKSSVLEALIGKDFLPHGNGVCTKLPVVIQLVPTNNQTEWGEFLHLPDRRFHDFSAIRNEIEAMTVRAGENKGVADQKISLKIFSTNILDITFVDLPAITHGDHIEESISTYINKGLIMTVISGEDLDAFGVKAAAKMRDNDAVKVARIADPAGYRTMGVITKLDCGKVVRVPPGFVGVVNPTQGIDPNLNRTEIYGQIEDRVGFPRLVEKFNKMLVQGITEISNVQISEVVDRTVVNEDEEILDFHALELCYLFAARIDKEIHILHSPILENYPSDFMESLRSKPVEYAKGIRAAGNSPYVEIENGYPGAETKFRPVLSNELWDKTEKACEVIVLLHTAKTRIMAYADARIERAAPSLFALVGGEVTTKVLSAAAGLDKLCKRDVAFLEMILRGRGVNEYKVMMAARMDMYEKDPTGGYGRELRKRLEAKRLGIPLVTQGESIPKLEIEEETDEMKKKKSDTEKEDGEADYEG